MTYSYRIYPDLNQEARMLTWMEQCRRVYNYALAERRDWIAEAQVCGQCLQCQAGIHRFG